MNKDNWKEIEGQILEFFDNEYSYYPKEKALMGTYNEYKEILTKYGKDITWLRKAVK